MIEARSTLHFPAVHVLRFVPTSLVSLSALAVGACGSTQAPPPQAAFIESRAAVEEPQPQPVEGEAPSPAGVAQNLAELEAQALAACQEAETLLDAGDAAGALAAVDKAYRLMLTLPDDEDTEETGPLEAEASDPTPDEAPGNLVDAHANPDALPEDAAPEGPTPERRFAQIKQDIRLVVAKVINRIYQANGFAQGAALTSSWDGGLPLVDNEHVQREIASFTGRERNSFIEAYKRSGLYRPMILQRLEEAGLPSQLSWLPLVESLFKVNALSRASALGLWQFISSTGLRYGLNRTDAVDERLDPIKATDAAISYLMDLHRLFGDWPKALAAYNCGENRIMRLQKQRESQFMDFWDLYALLPRETRRYVPRLIAVLQIVENPEKYGMELPEPLPPLPEAVTVEVAKPMKLDALEKELGLEPGILSLLNAELRYKTTPRGPYNLRVPASVESQVELAVAKVPEYVPPKPKYLVHRVRSGETLSSIAERYRTSITAIMQTNRIRSKHRIWVGQRLKIPTRG